MDEQSAGVDIVGIGLLLLSPFLVIVAIAIELSSHGPVFFAQPRGGRHGQPFKMLKFRSMYQDVGKRFHELAAQDVANGPVFRFANDPRIKAQSL